MSQLFEMCQAIVNYPKNEMTVKELSKIGKSLGSIENAIRENREVLRAIDIEKATVVVRKVKSKG